MQRFNKLGIQRDGHRNGKGIIVSDVCICFSLLSADSRSVRIRQNIQIDTPPQKHAQDFGFVREFDVPTVPYAFPTPGAGQVCQTIRPQLHN